MTEAELIEFIADHKLECYWTRNNHLALELDCQILNMFVQLAENYLDELGEKIVLLSNRKVIINLVEFCTHYGVCPLRVTTEGFNDLFRGKTNNGQNSPIPDGVWHYGKYKQKVIKTSERSYVRHTITDYNNVVSFVDPETVGRFIGLQSIDGDLLFEGDVVWVCGEPTDCKFTFKKNAIVPNFGYADLERIGSVHDNPEILNENRTIKDDDLPF